MVPRVLKARRIGVALIGARRNGVAQLIYPAPAPNLRAR